MDAWHLHVMTALPTAAFCQDQSSAPMTSPDNSAKNKAHSNTADQQSEATSDRMLTKKIRQSLVADKSLSTYGHNVKIITKDGMVTLKGAGAFRGREVGHRIEGSRSRRRPGQGYKPTHSQAVIAALLLKQREKENLYGR